MKVGNILIRMVLLVSIVIMGVWGCAGKPFDPPQTDEIPRGPGLFTTGSDGAVLYDSNQESLPSTSSSQSLATPSTDMEQTAASSDYEEFKDYQQWLLWKKSATGTPEYEEFKQWREWWKYQEWEKQN
ncbi:MAG: hypothetical protein QNK29_06065 [Desulfobacterales bacterium]|nr:hypothetical protein [Desulfobacterales bacterium]MDX2511496.1 hypothetical protein [Desulfobacterales bacterium]